MKACFELPDPLPISFTGQVLRLRRRRWQRDQGSTGWVPTLTQLLLYQVIRDCFLTKTASGLTPPANSDGAQNTKKKNPHLLRPSTAVVACTEQTATVPSQRRQASLNAVIGSNPRPLRAVTLRGRALGAFGSSAVRHRRRKTGGANHSTRGDGPSPTIWRRLAL